MFSLVKKYGEEYKITLNPDQEDFQSVLIKLAFPFSKGGRLVIAAPSGFKLNPDLLKSASLRAIQPEVVPLAQLPAEWVEKAKNRIIARSLDVYGFHYPLRTVHRFGRPEALYHLLPQNIRSQLF